LGMKLLEHYLFYHKWTIL